MLDKMYSIRSLQILAASPLILGIIPAGCQEAGSPELPNILWITSEDNSPLLGCYGNSFATTPVLDRLAEEGFLYTRAYANAPVCAPARNTIITGMYASSGGNQHMRSFYSKPEVARYYPHYLREKGYYTTNNAKEDYNIDPDQTTGIWDESGRNAHYRNRNQGQPFFAIFNTTISHESSIHTPRAPEDLRHDPEAVPLPPYHPDTPEIRHDWAYYYDRVEEMDAWVGEILKELEESGEAENTIVFYYADHGGILGRSKRYVYETGTHVPFIVRIPEKFKHLWPAIRPGSRVERLISFVDLAPTLLSIIDTPVPEYMQGQAFLGGQKTEDPEYAYMFRDRMDERYDMSRSVRDSKYRYIRNYMPHRIYGQPLEYLWRAPSMSSWETACRAGNCNPVQNAYWNTKPAEELYDTENDPWEVNNLAPDPACLDVLERMRKACNDWMIEIKDAGFIPEADLAGRTGVVSAYDHLRREKTDIAEIISAAEKSTFADPGDFDEIVSFLKSEESAIRYWGVTGLLLMDGMQEETADILTGALNDSSENVVIAAAEALYSKGNPEAGRSGLLKSLGSPNSFARTHALNVIDCVDDNSPEMRDAVIRMVVDNGPMDRQRFDLRAARRLLEKWDIDPAIHGIEFSW